MSMSLFDGGDEHEKPDRPAKVQEKNNGTTAASFHMFFRFSSAVDAMVKAVQRYKNSRMSEFGLRGMHLMFLCCLSHEKYGLTSSELADRCGVDKAFISRIAHELIVSGYIEYSDDGDEGLIQRTLTSRYKKKLVLTDRGLGIMPRINEMIEEAVNRVTDGLTGEQIKTFYKVLGVLEANLSALDTEATNLN